ncbi:MAG: ATP-binding protein [Methanomassiliicoccaceae archaeon]|nr:ATP-binding protein [Methanomassiliicoccaceae archaeon]
MYRLAYEELLEWKNDKKRRPLLLEGVRQCGKTYLLKEFGKKNYDNVVYLNFEGNDDLIGIFEPNLDTDRILARLVTFSREKIEPGKTLIIFDEIQACGRALTSLKYFCEDAPEYHIACAGSLLGVIMTKPHSFPVGKVDRIQMFPMNFKEFLLAHGEDLLVEEMDKFDPTDNFLAPFASRLEFYLDLFLTIGGMPAAVMSWMDDRDIKKVDRILDLITKDYEKDFSKHAAGIVEKLLLIWNSVPGQLARENKKFMFGHVKTGARASDLEDALQWLISAGLLYKVKLVNPPRMPLAMFADNTYFKLYMSDVGILRRMMKLNSCFDTDNAKGSELFKGAIVENYVHNELVSVNRTVPFFWRSEGTAEVDFIVPHGTDAIPIEVKSGRKASSKSLCAYIDRFKPKIAIITSLDAADDGAVKKIPLFSIWRYTALVPETKMQLPEWYK